MNLGPRIYVAGHRGMVGSALVRQLQARGGFEIVTRTHAAHRAGVEKLLLLGSSCIYPRGVPQPMREDALLTGVLEPTNEPYAVAKIAGIKLCESYHRQYGRDYRSVMPTNLYGPNDNFYPGNSHVIPAIAYSGPR